MSTMRRLYFYLVALVSLVVAANGTALLIKYVLDLVLRPTIAGNTSDTVSLGLAMVIVGGPLWLVHWGYAQRQNKNALESGAVLRKLYVYLALFIGATIMFVAMRSLLRWAMGVDAFSSIWIGQLVVWGVVWAYHWLNEQREGQPSGGAQTVRRWYLYVASGYSLVALSVGLAMMLAAFMTLAYDNLFHTKIIPGLAPFWSTASRSAIAWAVTGLLGWNWHWLVLARRDIESTLQQVYLYLFAFLGGGLTVIISAALVLDAVLAWLLQAPGTSPAAPHFRIIPRALPAMAVGLALLGYHWGVVQEESRVLAGRMPGARRSFGYIVAALGLASLATGLAIVLGTGIGQLVSAALDALTGAEQLRRTLAFGLTLLIIGAPLWLTQWHRVQREAELGGVAERGNVIRRIFLYAVLGVLALAALGSLTGFLTMLLRSLLGGSPSLSFLREGRWLLATAASAGVFLSYYWQVLREDQRAGAETLAARKQVTLVVGESAEGLVEQLTAALGGRPRVLRVVAPGAVTAVLTPKELAALAQQVRDAPSERVLVVATGGTTQVYGYREDGGMVRRQPRS